MAAVIGDLRFAIAEVRRTFKSKSQLIHRESWQAIPVATKPEMETYELVGPTLVTDLGGHMDRAYYQKMINPDLPWADDHFAERVSGKPLNPPPSESWWPHAPKGNEVFKKGGIFSHTYPERLWPKLAGGASDTHMGIRYPYGDLSDVVDLLRREPFTRQAYIPLFFPEDTGNVMHERTPCTLGYHILRTGNRVDIFYYIRSCDLLRHFRNDVYFTCRLLLWVLDRLDTSAKPGFLRMYMSSLHCFKNDWQILYGATRDD